MRKNNCEVIRQQLDELMLEEAFSSSAVKHLQECSACREFHLKQTKLRQIVGSLGTITAPADFDFRLRARLANDSSSAAFHLRSAYWSFARRGFAVAAVLIVFAIGIVWVRSVVTRPEVVATKDPASNPQPAKIVDTPEPPRKSEEFSAAAPHSGPSKIKNERSLQTGPRVKRSTVAVDFSSERAEVTAALEPVGTSAIFPIDASLHPLKVSLDDGRGNARTISVPTISFGSQRMLQSGNQFAPKGVW